MIEIASPPIRKPGTELKMQKGEQSTSNLIRFTMLFKLGLNRITNIIEMQYTSDKILGESTCF